MTAPYILMTIAFVIMLIVAIVQTKANKRLNRELDEMRNKELFQHVRHYRRNYKYMVIKNAGDNRTINNTDGRYHDEGYDLDREKSTDRLLVFVKCEEMKNED